MKEIATYRCIYVYIVVFLYDKYTDKLRRAQAQKNSHILDSEE